MTTITRYIAFDGEEFSSMTDCMRWEYKITHLPTAVIFYDQKGRPLNTSGNPDLLEEEYNSSGYVEIANIPTMEEDLKFCFSYWGWYMPENAGIYKFDDRENKWVKTTWEEEGIE